jgi:DNA-binding LacI/PurR family transcriptional regulator
MRLRGRRAHLYGVLVASAGDPLRGMLVQQLDLEAAHHGCQLLIGNTVLAEAHPFPNRFNQRVNEYVQQGVDGILCAVHTWHPFDRRALLEAQPHTVFYDDPGYPGAACVVPDRARAVTLLLHHLAGRGRRRIALATLSRKIPSHVERATAYRKELAAMDLPFDSKLLFVGEEHGFEFNDSGSDTSLDMPAEMPDAALDRLVRDANADAIICHDDFLAANMLRRLRARNVDPGKIAIVGYLNHSLGGFTDPALTTIDPGYDLAAKNMVALLERMITGDSIGKDERVVKVEPTLVVRDSG